MTASDWTLCSAPSSSSASPRPCAGASICAPSPGYRSAENLRVIGEHGYIAHVVDRRKEIDIKRRDPTKKARRWVVEVCDSWFNRFLKLLVRYEKLERSFVALNHLAAAIIVKRKPPTVRSSVPALPMG